MARYDVLIKNGTVFDGRGSAPSVADVGIVGDEIKRIGDLSGNTASKIIDATDKYVSPGFIDLTNHSDTHWTIFSQPSQESLLHQGITTILGGNCGSSLAPFLGKTSMEEIQRWVDVSKINVNWATMKEFLKEMENHKLSVNFCTLTGFNTIQRTEMEINQIKLLLKDSLEAGSFGVSTNFGLVYGRTLKDDEIIDLFKLAKKYGALIKHHLEDEGENILPSLSRLISLAQKSGTQLHISHFKALGKNSWKFIPGAIEMIKNAIKENLKITCDFFPYTKTGSSLLILLPSWFRKLPLAEAKNILETKSDGRKKDLIESLKKLTLHYDKIIVASGFSELGAVGKTIEQLSKTSGLSGEDIILDLLWTNNLRVSIFNEVINEENIEAIAKEEFSAIASDGVGYQLSAISRQPSAISDLPHPRSFGAFPRAFNLLVKQKSILKWEEAIWKMSGLAAEILGIKNRGVLAKGNKADIIIFNPVEISDRATYDNPFQYSRGVDYVLINGTTVLDNKEFTGKFPGYILRKK
ncbi:MAG: amidohydrolase family protein [Candidatus Terrybacteria bacterium]|nr:amidohydrolase family protein [Candidatus Terrybacteria bacterium]